MTFRERLRTEVKQLRHGLKPYRRRTTTIRRELSVRRAMEAPALVRRRREPGSVWAVGLVRNEADVIEACVTHLLSQGVDHVVVADNLSTDGTASILRRMASVDSRVHVLTDREPAFHQASKATHLARLARRSGADWIIPFDADEFWFATGGSVSEVLRRTGANTVRALVFNAVPVGSDAPISEASLLQVESVPQPLGKRAVRAHRWLRLERGNHEVGRAGAIEDGLIVLHVPYRGPAQLRRKHAPEALVDRLASAEADQAVQYRNVGRLDGGTIDEAWMHLQSGMPEPRLNWVPAPTRLTDRPLSWGSWPPQLLDESFGAERGAD